MRVDELPDIGIFRSFGNYFSHQVAFLQTLRTFIRARITFSCPFDFCLHTDQ
jgi:hypothetical protein